MNRLILFAARWCSAAIACANNYPTPPVRIIVSVAAGGGTDTVGRSPAHTPLPIRQTLQSEILRSLQVPEVRARL